MVKHPFRGTDAITSVLHGIRIDGVFTCQSELTAPWGLTMPPQADCMWFHVVTEGRCLLDVDGDEPLVLERGSFALVPHGRGHRVRSTRRVATPNVMTLPHAIETDRYALLRYGGGGERATLVCGIVRLAPPMGPELERLLPKAIHLAARDVPHSEWMDSTLTMMAAEARTLRPGGETVLARLADVLVIQTIRAWLESDQAKRGWLGALRDPQIGRSLAALWQTPSTNWTVASLAARAAMSRSAFAQRFTTLVGEPPMQHVTRVRMQVASVALRQERASVGVIADRLGYQSQAAFARAFKRFVGKSPGALRRAA